MSTLPNSLILQLLQKSQQASPSIPTFYSHLVTKSPSLWARLAEGIPAGTIGAGAGRLAGPVIGGALGARDIWRAASAAGLLPEGISSEERLTPEQQAEYTRAAMSGENPSMFTPGYMATATAGPSRPPRVDRTPVRVPKTTPALPSTSMAVSRGASAGLPPPPQSAPASAEGWTPEEEVFYQSIRDKAIGAPTTPTTPTGEAAPFTAVRTAGGRVVFTNVPGEYTNPQGNPITGGVHEGGEDIGYGAGVEAWKERAFAEQPAPTRGGMNPEFLAVPGTGGFSPSAPVPLTLPADPVAALAEVSALPHMGAREAAMQRWFEQEELRGAGAERKRVEAQAGLFGGEEARSRAEAEFAKARGEQLAPSERWGRQKGLSAVAEAAATEEGRRMYATAYLQSPEGQREVEAAYQAAIAGSPPKNQRQADMVRRLVQSKVWQGKIQELATIAQEPGIVRSGYNPLAGMYGGGFGGPY